MSFFNVFRFSCPLGTDSAFHLAVERQQRSPVLAGAVFLLVFLLVNLLFPILIVGQTERDAVSESPLVVRVFLLAGQSNMQGHGVVDLDHPEHYNGGLGTLKQVMKDSPNRHMMQHLVDDDGDWVERDDVFVWYQTDRSLKVGPLSVGFSGYEGKHHFGPEMQLGHILGDAFEEPVLLVKTAWGGKSLNVDFRPPSSGEPGEYYLKMLRELGQAMEKAQEKIPQLSGATLKLQGVFWQQGWNDMVDEAATKAYPMNPKNFIIDLRKQFLAPDLPFVYGELGNGGSSAGAGLNRFRQAQASVAKMNLPNVRYVPTAGFARLANRSPNQGHLHHWFGNAESYFLVGDALGREMVAMLIPKSKRKRVLILGDSISMGYTSHVRELLSPCAIVVRATNPKGKPENCQGTDYGVKHIDRWLAQDGGQWDVIHFNFGLHDMKHVDAKTQKNSNRFEDPLQSSPQEYQQQLRSIVDKLVATKAKLIFATTTPVPEGVTPARETTSPMIYNTLALQVIGRASTESNRIAVDDLYSFANGRLAEIQRPKNVHFTPIGSRLLAAEVAKSIRKALEDRSR